MATTNLKCTECGYEASSEADKKQHMQQKHNTESGNKQNRQNMEDSSDM